MLYSIFYKSTFALLISGGLCFLISYCIDLFNFLRNKSTNYKFYHNFQVIGKSLIGTGIFFGIISLIAFFFI